MKLCLILLTFTFIFISVDAGQFTAKIKSIAGKCQKKENASDNDVENVSEGLAPETPEGKCLSACMGEQFGIVSKNFSGKKFYKKKIYTATD